LTQGPIDFVSLAAALLDRAYTLVPQWLPHGTERNGRWYVGDFDGGEGESANVNLATGRWIDNAALDEDKGGDLISLYARIRGLNNGQAARELMRDLGWERQHANAAQAQTPGQAGAANAPASAPTEQLPADVSHVPAQRANKERWRAVLPVPRHAPIPQRFRFGFKDKKAGAWVELDAVKTWEYVFEGQRYGYVARFERISSDGELVKDTVPLTWCEDTQDPHGAQRWHWKQWAAPRPLYVPASLLSGDLSLAVVVVEGEKCAEAGHKLLGHEFDFVSWPGGCKVWSMAAWGWLRGRTVYLWPDADAKRRRLQAAEREAGADPSTMPLLPEHKQPGMAAMVGIGQLLQAEYGCTVLMCPAPAPGVKPDGWDIADAIDSGWDAVRVRDFIRASRSFVAPDDAVRAAAEPISTPSNAGASKEQDGQPWRGKLLKNGNGATTKDRENIVLALDGMPDIKLAGIPEAAGVVAFNELTNDVVKLKASPWGTPAGAWAEVDDLLMGEWLVRTHWMPSIPRGTLEEAVRMVAYRHRYHPVREYLKALEWDKTPRLATWLRKACLEEDEWDDKAPLQRYLARVGTFFVMAMCARVMTPGCKFDYMLILEGAQGMRKSTLLRILAGDWFADTGLVLGDKDSYQQLQGIWLYEIPELDAFSKADVMKIKAYVASQEDYFRASFDRRAAKYPRQLVFAGTTNEDHYLTDPTGNRRFWPVRVTRRVDTDWVQSVRDQLLAEAMARLARGARMFPPPDEELDLFVPQQQARAVENAIESAVARYLYPPAGASGANSDGDLVEEISLVSLLGKVGIGLEKLGPGRFHEKQAAAALRRLGWTEGRSSQPGRPRVYRRPKPDPLRGSGDSSASPAQGDSTKDTDDGCPF
jgi:putative DNA primase/helicase